MLSKEIMVQQMDKGVLATVRRVAMFSVMIGLLCVVSGQAEELTIAAAADLNFAFKELVAEFEKTTGHHVKLSLGSSGNFFSQLQHGAPFDLYFSADIRYPQKLIEAGSAVPDSLYRYATGRIVVWAPRQSSLDLGQRGMEALLDPSIRKIAIANPKHAPYGRAAVAAMEHFRLYDRVKDKLVFGENVSQTAQFIDSGAADIGIIALSLALAPAMKQAGTFWLIPEDSHSAIDQGAVIVKGSQAKDVAKAFLDFLRRNDARTVMQRYGFVLPGEPRATEAP